MLTVVQSAISVAFGTVSFLMTDTDKTVCVDVCQQLLASLDGPRLTIKQAYVKRLLSYRSELAQIAIAKYEEGQFQRQVNVLVVRVTAGDL